MSRPVTYAQLRDVFFIPAMKNGNFGPTLPPQNTILKNFRMSLQDSGDLLMEWDEGNFTASYTVSQSNIKGVKHLSVPMDSSKVSAPPPPVVASVVAPTPAATVAPVPVPTATLVKPASKSGS